MVEATRSYTLVLVVHCCITMYDYYIYFLYFFIGWDSKFKIVLINLYFYQNVVAKVFCIFSQRIIKSDAFLASF